MILTLGPGTARTGGQWGFSGGLLPDRVSGEASLDQVERAVGLVGGVLGDGFGALARLTGRARTDGVEAFVSAMDVVFWGAAAVMAVGVVLALRLPRSGTRPGSPSIPGRAREEQPVAA
ncbi:hypothetical protein ABZT23_35840 [Streptomyces sp. NPDC005386]|uniref:hypothetical protein n=1 Tax=Streptomyces sp. NPDC005386 TaxID=3154562 RepID=UPI00339F9DFB